MPTTGLSEAAKVRLTLVEQPSERVAYSWIGLASAGLCPDNLAHLATAALRMKTDVNTARRRLMSAHWTLNNPETRVEGSLKIACAIAGVKLREVAVGKQSSTRRVTRDALGEGIYRAKDRQLRVIPRHHNLSVAVDDAEREFLPVDTYIDEDPRNPLRRRIEEVAAAGIR
jgi:hypothetical protein